MLGAEDRSSGENTFMTTSTARRTSHEIIVNDLHQYVVWPASRRLPEGWRYLGKSGTKDELEFYVREMFVETAPVPFRPA